MKRTQIRENRQKEGKKNKKEEKHDKKTFVCVEQGIQKADSSHTSTTELQYTLSPVVSLGCLTTSIRLKKC